MLVEERQNNPFGQQSSHCFVDIESFQHRFPNQVAHIGFSTSLLHIHKHQKVGSFLTYMNDFRVSEYLSEHETRNHFPCAWHMENGTVKPYEFCDEEIPYDLQEITNNLKRLNQLGYIHYGTTVRPIRRTVEIETEKGHEYVPIEEFDLSIFSNKYSQTVSNGKKVGWCFSVCLNINGRHGGMHR